MGRPCKADSKVRRNLGRRWISMMGRCYDTSHPRYPLYGGNGVRVCLRWHDKEVFMRDALLIEGYDEDLLLAGKLYLDKDTKSKRKIYSLKSCAFISIEESNKHKPNQMVKFVGRSPDGKKYVGLNQSEFARNHELGQSSISACLKGKLSTHRGWTFEYVTERSTTIESTRKRK